jgi:hypothetical protein
LASSALYSMGAGEPPPPSGDFEAVAFTTKAANSVTPTYAPCYAPMGDDPGDATSEAGESDTDSHPLMPELQSASDDEDDEFDIHDYN